MAVVAATHDDDSLFSFTCTYDFANVAKTLQLLKSRLGTCINSGASRVYCPDHTKFTNYKSIDQTITTANGRGMRAIGMGDLEIEMPNGSKTTNIGLKR